MKLKSLSILVLLAALLFSFAACGSDDDDDDSIIGVWEYNGTTGYSIEVETNNPIISNVIKVSLEEPLVDKNNYTAVFSPSGEYQITGNSVTERGTYTYSDNILAKIKSDGIKSNINVFIDDNKLTISEDYKSLFFDIDGNLNHKSPNLTNLFILYPDALQGLTPQDLKSVSKVQINYTYTRK